MTNWTRKSRNDIYVHKTINSQKGLTVLSGNGKGKAESSNKSKLPFNLAENFRESWRVNWLTCARPDFWIILGEPNRPTVLIEAGAVWTRISGFPFTGDLIASFKDGGVVNGPGFDRLDLISLGLFFPSYLPSVELDKGLDRSKFCSKTPSMASGIFRVDLVGGAPGNTDPPPSPWCHQFMILFLINVFFLQNVQNSHMPKMYMACFTCYAYWNPCILLESFQFILFLKFSINKQSKSTIKTNWNFDSD